MERRPSPRRRERGKSVEAEAGDEEGVGGEADDARQAQAAVTQTRLSPRNERLFGTQEQKRPDGLDLLPLTAEGGWQCSACKALETRSKGWLVHTYGEECAYSRIPNAHHKVFLAQQLGRVRRGVMDRHVGGGQEPAERRDLAEVTKRRPEVRRGGETQREAGEIRDRVALQVEHRRDGEDRVEV